MDIAQEKAKINKLEAKEKEVGHLLLDLCFNLIACGDEGKVYNSDKLIGQIDLLFVDKITKKILLVEVSRQQHDRADKAGNFFRKWSDKKNIQAVVNKFNLLSTYKFIYLYFDLSGEGRPDSVSVEVGKGEYYLTKDDFDYFKDAINKVGKFARNDFLSFLNIKPTEFGSVDKDAIQFYLGEDIRAYAYVDSVENLLKYCYVFRRKKDDKGYQRMLEKEKIARIANKISRGNILAFPNALLLSSPDNSELCAKQREKSDCPAHVTIKIPKEYCACRIIDGQHRLLSFANLEQKYHESHFIPVVILENILQPDEMKTFIEINAGQKRIDKNLILVLEADFEWTLEDNPKEYLEKQAVEIVKKLNSSAPLSGKIFIPHALEKKKRKIMLNTFVSAIIGNNFIGGKFHLFQRDISDIEAPYSAMRLIFSKVKQYMPGHATDVGDFFLTNKGLRVIFRLIQIFERNKIAKKVTFEQEQFIKDLKLIMTNELVATVDEYYGEGGSTLATEKICALLKTKRRSAYSHFTSDLRSI